MGGVNKPELMIIDWLKGERERGSGLWGYLKDVADGNDSEWGDLELTSLLADLLDSRHAAHADILLSSRGVDLRTVRTLRRELAALYDSPDGWLEHFEGRVIRVLLMQIHRHNALYVHPLLVGYDPENRYLVADEDFVFEGGITPASGRFRLPAENRQICDEPISAPCSCRFS